MKLNQLLLSIIILSCNFSLAHQPHSPVRRIAVFPGSFDPFTRGHQELIKQLLPLFDQIIISVGYNPSKTGLFTVEQRIEWIKETFKNEAKVSVTSHTGLTVEFCKQHNAQFIIRGLRNTADFESEKSIAHMNNHLAPSVQTVFALTNPEHCALSSSVVREIFLQKGNVSDLIPQGITLKILTSQK